MQPELQQGGLDQLYSFAKSQESCPIENLGRDSEIDAHRCSPLI